MTSELRIRFRTHIALPALLALVLGSVACQPNGNVNGELSPVAPKPNADAVAEGGVNGGGGGTLPAVPISTYEVRKVIQTAKSELNVFIKGQMYSLSIKNPSALEAKLYLSSPNIWDVLHTTDIELLNDQPCKDAQGNDVDGSVHASKPNTICISAFRIAPKLIKERAQTEILALILHELSHLLGANETEAQAYQKDAAWHLSPSDSLPHLSGEAMIEKAQTSIEEVGTLLWKLKDGIGKMSNAELSYAILNVDMGINKFQQVALDYPFSIMSAKEAAYFSLQEERLDIARLYIESQADMPNANRSIVRLNEIFLDHDQATYKELKERLGYGHTRDNSYDGEILLRIKTAEEFKAQVIAFIEYLEKVDHYMRQLLYRSRPNNLPTPDTLKTPWLDFVGEYQVTSSTCASDMTVGYKILFPGYAPTELRLVQLWKNGYGDAGGLIDGANVVSIANGVFVTGGANWAQRLDEYGDRWANQGGQDWNEHSLKIEKLPDGKFQMSEQNHWRTFDGVRQTYDKDEFRSCVRVMQKK